MILVVGRPDDAVLARQRSLLAEAGAPTLFLDDHAVHTLGRSRSARQPGWRVEGAACTGKRRVGAVLVRRGPYGEVGRGAAATFGRRLDQVLMQSAACVVNRPGASAGNYSKLHQLLQLARAGFAVPPTLATASPDAARRFIVEHQGRVLIKGLSSTRTRPEAVGVEHLQLLEGLRHRPTQFQALIEGAEYRLTVLAGRAWATPVLPQFGEPVDARTLLPADTLERCLRFVAAQGLVLGGFDFIVDAAGIWWCLELNPNPLITHYEDAADAPLSRALRDHLLASSATGGDIYV